MCREQIDFVKEQVYYVTSCYNIRGIKSYFEFLNKLEPITIKCQEFKFATLVHFMVDYCIVE